MKIDVAPLVQSVFLQIVKAELSDRLRRLKLNTRRAMPVPLPAVTQPEPSTPARNVKLAQRLRDQADRLQKKIDTKLNPAIGRQNPTQKRSRIAAGMASEGFELQKQQNAMRRLADEHEAGTVPNVVAGVKDRTAIQALLYWTDRNWQDLPQDTRKRLQRNGIGKAQDFYDARELIADYRHGETSRVTQVKLAMMELERELIGAKIPGFFPTPEALAKQVAELANIQPGMKVLEPSAGKGDLIRACWDAQPEIESLVAYEINHTLEQYLKKYRETWERWQERENTAIVGEDCIAGRHEQQYDRIVMNPPFENCQDAKHIVALYASALKPGGRLVAIMGEHCWFASNKESQSWREWIERMDRFGQATWFKNEPGAFKSSFRPTGVQTRIVVIDKPE